MDIIKIDKLNKLYGKAIGVEEVNLEIMQGEVFGFIGPNGAGKSTTIRCIMDLINKNSGDIYIEKNLLKRNNYEIKQDIGYLPSEIHLYDDLTVEKMLNYSASFYQEKNCKEKIEYLVNKLEVDLNKRIDELSFGNLKKVGIILALMHSPKIVVLDEATSGLDPLMQEKFYEILKEEKERGTTIFFSSHILREIKRICDRVAIIKDGKIIKIEKTNDLTDTNFNIITIISKDIDKIKKDLNLELLKQTDTEIKFIYNENINQLIETINKYNLDKILIEEPSIEEIFMHYYK